MKQNVSYEQVDELPDEQLLVLVKWMEKKGYDVGGSYMRISDEWEVRVWGHSDDHPARPTPTIGQMIEFLDDCQWFDGKQDMLYKRGDWILQAPYHVTTGFLEGKELCDVLWRAVKNELYKHREKTE